MRSGLLVGHTVVGEEWFGGCHTVVGEEWFVGWSHSGG